MCQRLLLLANIQYSYIYLLIWQTVKLEFVLGVKLKLLLHVRGTAPNLLLL